MSVFDKLQAAITEAHEKLADGLRRLSDFHTASDLESAKVVSAQLGATHADLVRLHKEVADVGNEAKFDAPAPRVEPPKAAAPIDADGVDDSENSEMYARADAPKAEGPGSGVI